MRATVTARRVLTQLVHDRRTLALIVLAPCLFMVILRYMLDGQPMVFTRIGAMILGIFPCIVMFIVASVAMLRERRSGTLERLFTLPITKFDLLLGYGLAFGLMVIVQVSAVTGLAVGLLGLDAHYFVLLLAVATAGGWLGVAMGLFASAFARSEFQAVQFMPAFILPQLLLAGFFVPREAMQVVLRVVADFMPLTYVVDAVQGASGPAIDGGKLSLGLLVIFAFIVASLVAGALTLKRQN